MDVILDIHLIALAQRGNSPCMHAYSSMSSVFSPKNAYIAVDGVEKDDVGDVLSA